MLIFVAMMVLPLFLLSGFYLYTAWLILYYAILASGWNIGRIGNVISLANFGYVGIGAYSYGLATLNNLPFASALFLSGIVPVICMIPVSFLLMIKLRGLYFSVGTFVVPLIASALIQVFYGTGLYIPFQKAIPINQSYIILATLTFFSVAFTAWMTWSRYGLALRSMFDAEAAAEANGVNTGRLKLIIFLVPAFFGGMAGAALASSLSFLDTDVVFAVGDLLLLILATLIGGAGTVFGPVIGAVIVTILTVVLGIYLPYGHLAVYGVIVIAVVLGKPIIQYYRANLRSRASVKNVTSS